MPVVLFRVDERLIHGQVVVGWGAELHPDCIVVVDDDLAGSPWEQELYTLGLPPEVEATFIGVADARRHLDDWRRGDRRVILLTRDVQTIGELAAGGLMRGEQVNIGGIHYAPGRRAVLPYVYLSAGEERALERLAEEGVTVTARDLPGSRRVGLDELLQHESRDR
jgi:PTS system mannose-specific IIB component/fructoselysine and glucoselysine-specific PTS system IIB component